MQKESIQALRQGEKSKEDYRNLSWFLGDEIMKTKANQEQRKRDWKLQ